MDDSPKKTIYEFIVKDNKGKDFNFNDLKGKVVLIVNVASKCGFTSQYKDLEEIYQKYKDKGLEIIAFPCNQFLNQEPGTDEEIASFCSLNYNVSFPIMKKVDVNGENESPIYKYLKSKKAGWFSDDIKWNFTKFLVDQNGNVIERFAPTKTPEAIDAEIAKLFVTVQS